MWSRTWRAWSRRRASRASSVVASTDDGHDAPAIGPTAADWALGHREKIIDYGYRAVHLTAVAAKLSLTIDTHYQKSHYDKMVTKALEQDGAVLIAWQHEDIPLLTKGGQPGISQSILTQTQTPPGKFDIPKAWPSGPQGARYDLVFVFHRPAGKGPIEKFSLIGQMLLAGDAPPSKSG